MEGKKSRERMDLKGENFILEGEKFNGEKKNAKYRNWLSSTRIRLSSWKP